METARIHEIFQTSSQLKLACSESLTPVIAKTADAMIGALKKGRKICWMGNGGSAADAQHMAAELVSRFYKERQALPSLSFHENTSSLTAIANDYEYEKVFERQVEAFVQPGDIVVGLSTSGRSKNVLRALKKAKEMNGVTVGLTGEDPSLLREFTDYCISVPSRDTPRIQECHTTIGHILCELIEKAFLVHGK